MSSEIFGEKLYHQTTDSIIGTPTNNYTLIEVEHFIYDSIELNGEVTLIIDNEWHPSKYAVRKGVVRGVPSKLYSHLDDVLGMDWVTDIEIQEGDDIWFSGMIAHNAQKIMCGDKRYILMHYEDLFVVKRGEKVIPLNGYIIMEPIESEIKALSFSKNEIDDSKAVIVHNGSDNESYRIIVKQDDPYIEDGDIAILSGQAIIYLEQKPYLSFNGKSMIIMQKCNLYAVQHTK
jgi:hypothetical protein